MEGDQPILEGDLRDLARQAFMQDSSRVSLREALADLVPEKGLTRERITRALIAEGWQREEARRFSGEVLDAASDRAIRSSQRLEDALLRRPREHGRGSWGDPFGTTEEEVWRRFADEIGAWFVKSGIGILGRIYGGRKVLAKWRSWTITIDTRKVRRSAGEYAGSRTYYYTRVRAPFVNVEGLRFTVYRKTLFSGLGKVLGMQDVETDYPAFDREFIVKANHESKVRALLANERIRQLMDAEPAFVLRVQHPWRLFGGRLPKGIDELHLEVPDRITEGIGELYVEGADRNYPVDAERLKSFAVERLKSLYELAAETLNQLCRIGSASEEDPGVKL